MNLFNFALGVAIVFSYFCIYKVGYFQGKVDFGKDILAGKFSPETTNNGVNVADK